MASVNGSRLIGSSSSGESIETKLFLEHDKNLVRKVRAAEDLIVNVAFEENQFVDAHNERRINVVPTAANMNLMSWDQELADLAANHSKLVIFGHAASFDKCAYVTFRIL